MTPHALILPFGKYQDLPLAACPESYLRWLLDPILSSGEVYHLPPPFQAAASAVLDSRRMGTALYYGHGFDSTRYLVTFDGPLAARLGRAYGFLSQEAALAWLATLEPDPDEDQILIWTCLPSGHRKVCWFFEGWAWAQTETWQGLEPGRLPGQLCSWHQARLDAIEAQCAASPEAADA